MLTLIPDTSNFWKFLKSLQSREKVESEISPVMWYNHFKSLFAVNDDQNEIDHDYIENVIADNGALNDSF